MAEVFVPLLVGEAECPYQKVEVSAAVVVVTLNPLKVLVASLAVMKNLGSESQVVQEALVADQARSHQCPCQNVPADQVLQVDLEVALDQKALRAP